jgi:hypothetical protein
MLRGQRMTIESSIGLREYDMPGYYMANEKFDSMSPDWNVYARWCGRPQMIFFDAPSYVDRIFRGERPSGAGAGQIVINLKTAFRSGRSSI